MLGKANEIKTKLVFRRFYENPKWNASNPTSAPRYITAEMDEVINEALALLGDANVIQIQYQMSADNGDTAEMALIIYKEC